MRLLHKVIIVTGSTTGIGKAIAVRCVAEGAKVVVHGLEESWGNAVVTELGKENAVLHIEDISNEGAPLTFSGNCSSGFWQIGRHSQ